MCDLCHTKVPHLGDKVVKEEVERRYFGEWGESGEVEELESE